MPRNDDSLIGKRIGEWLVIAKRERHETPSGRRAVYVLQHDDGFTKGIRANRLSRFMAELGGAE